MEKLVETDLDMLKEAYDLRLSATKEVDLFDCSANLEYTATYLKFLRDYFVLTENLVVGDVANVKIASITAALKEYQNYKTCENKYYKFTNHSVEQIVEGTPEEIMKRYGDEKQQHLENFLAIVASNIEIWRAEYVTL